MFSVSDEMTRTIRYFLSVCCVVALFFVFQAPCGAEQGEGPAPAVIRNTAKLPGQIAPVPQPTLLEPTLPTVDISGKQFVEFRWEPKGSPYRVWYYVFHLYKGYEMAPVRQLYAREVSALTAAIAISIDYFKDGESYTWSVVQVDAGPLFSEPACDTFRVVKK